MTNQTEPPIESLLIDMRKRLSAASGWTDKAIAEMPNHVIEHMTSTAREVLAALEPSPESSLIELIEAARFTHELSDTRIAFNKGIDTAIRLIKGRDDLHPSPDTVPCDTCGNLVPDRGAAKSWCSDACYERSGEALVGKLEAEMLPDSDGNEVTMAWKIAFTRAIAIVRQHVEGLGGYSEKLLQPDKLACSEIPVVSIEEGAKAVAAFRFPHAPVVTKGSKELAKVCATAWGLKYVE